MTLTLLSTTQEGTHLYQCTCGAMFERKHKTTKCPECAPSAILGKSSHPLYKTWAKNYKAQWPDFMAFVKEALEVSPTPGTLPPPIYQLRPKNPGTKTRPGNLCWNKQDILYIPTTTDPDAMDKHRKKLNDDPEFKRLWEQAHKELTDPVAEDSIGVMLSRLEEKFTLPTGLSDAELYEAEIQREEEAQEFARDLQMYKDDKFFEKNSGSQSTTGRALRFQLVPLLEDRMKEHYATGMKANAGTNLHIVHDIHQLVDFWTMAHITTTVTLDALGRGTTFQTMESALYMAIGKAIEHQAFLETTKREAPDQFSKIDRFVLKNPVGGYGKKMTQARKQSDVAFVWMSNPDCVKLGNWAWANLQSVTNWFETLKFWNKKWSHSVYYIGLSEKGLEQAAVVQKAKLDACIKLWPMVHRPLDWANGERGGYLKYNWRTAKLVHGCKGTDGFSTTPSEKALAALNHYQSIPLCINPFIYGVQKALITSTNEIGAFKSYEKDSWMDQNMPLIDPAVWDLPSVIDDNGNRQVHPDKKKAKRDIASAHKERKLAEKQRQSPKTVLQVAARYLNVERFYLPMYMDYRLRMYYQVDTLNPQGSDYQKGLMMFADGNPITASNREIVRRDLLITMANCWSGTVDETNIKSDKLPMHKREQFGRKLVKEGAVAAADPLSTQGRNFWEKADEPFQFLAALREYYEIFEMGTRTVAQVANGRDASNSGMALQGGFLRDERMCEWTNVLNLPEPKDAYELVAKHARMVLADKEWVMEQKEAINIRIDEADARRIEEDPQYKPDKSRRVLTITGEHLTRKVCKRPVMCSGYGASWGSKNEYVSEELDELFKSLYGKGKNDRKPTLMDKVIATNAIIIGQREAFPRQDLINKWFQNIGAACLDRGKDRVKWISAAGSIAIQEYREPIYVQVDTYGMGGARYREVVRAHDNTKSEESHTVSVRVGWGDVIESKTQSALAANWTHSMDASIMQLASEGMQDFSTYVVHDCVYCPAGKVEEMVVSLKKAYLNVVGPDYLQDLNNQNGTDVEAPAKGEVDIFRSLKSDYMFS